MMIFGREAENLPTMPFLLEIQDAPDNILRILAALPDIGEPGTGEKTGLETVDSILETCRPVTPDPDAVYEITFEPYILYQVRSESYCAWDSDEVQTGQYFSILTRSRLLDQVDRVTDCCRLPDGFCYPGPWTHYRICGQNHVVDVIAQDPPKIVRRTAEKDR